MIESTMALSSRKIIIIVVLALFLGQPLVGYTAEVSLAERLSGRILLQVESYGRAWYVEPVSHTRYYLRDGEMAYAIMRQKGLGISNSDLARLPQVAGRLGDSKLVTRLKGRIVLAVQSRGEAWYINPVDGLRYYLADGEAAYQLMRTMGLGVTTVDLAKITMNDEQVVPDTAFSDVAYTHYNGQSYSDGHDDTVILPLASLTKLMTALVILDTNPDWDAPITISQAVIDYPRNYVGDDSTSEVAIALGDRISRRDLWSALLVASSNQSAAALVDTSGLSRADFIAKMNAKATTLGLVKTQFVDVAGLDAHNVSTVREYAVVAHAAFSQPLIAATSRQTTATMRAQAIDGTWRDVPVANRNYSLLAFAPDGAKTGFLVEAQRNVALQKSDKTIIVFHARSMNERNTIIERLLSE